MKTSMQKALATFYENLTKTQRDENYYLNPVGISRRVAIVSLLKITHDDVVGDLGCGEGLIVAKLLGAKRMIFGCDLSPSRAKIALSNGVKALAADVTQLPYQSESFDKVICSEVLEHLIEPGIALAEIYRVLRAGGAAILTVPLYDLGQTTLLDLPEKVLENGNYYDIKKQFEIKNTHLSSFTEQSFKDILFKCGFEIDDFTFTYNYTLSHPRLYKIVMALYRGFGKLEFLSRLRPAFEKFINLMILTSYQRTGEKHHIVVRARKIGS